MDALAIRRWCFRPAASSPRTTGRSSASLRAVKAIIMHGGSARFASIWKVCGNTEKVCLSWQICATRSVQFNSNRAMVRPWHIAPDKCAFEPRSQRGRDKDIINSPANVPFPCSQHGAPPGIVAATFLEFAEGINESSLGEGAKSRAFLRGEPVSPDVLFWVREVQFHVRNIEIATKNHWLPALQPNDVI